MSPFPMYSLCCRGLQETKENPGPLWPIKWVACATTCCLVLSVTLRSQYYCQDELGLAVGSKALLSHRRGQRFVIPMRMTWELRLLLLWC